MAMLDAAVERLGMLLDDSLCYVHSSGVTDSRASYLQKLSSGALRYDSLLFASARFTLLGKVDLVRAEMHATVLRNGGGHAVASTYLAVWHHGASGWALHMVQATPLVTA